MKWISYTYTHIPSLLDLPPTPHPTPLDHHRAPSWVSCALQQVPTSYLFYTWVCLCVNSNLPVLPILFFPLLIQPLRRAVQRFLKKLKIELPYDPAILLLGIYPEKTIIQKDSCTPMFTVALFTIARTWKPPKCPWRDERIKKMWYVYSGILLSHKKSKLGSFVEMWIDLESVMLSDIRKGKTNIVY